MTINPNTYDVEGAAQAVFADILASIRNGEVPANVRTFTDLHDHVDANEYVQEVPWGTDLPAGSDPYALVNAVTDRVNALLADRTPAERLSVGETMTDSDGCEWTRGVAGDSERCEQCGGWLTAGGPAMRSGTVVRHVDHM